MHAKTYELIVGGKQVPILRPSMLKVLDNQKIYQPGTMNRATAPRRRSKQLQAQLDERRSDVIIDFLPSRLSATNFLERLTRVTPR